MWYPTVVEGVKLLRDRGVLLAPVIDGAVGGKVYVPPKVWAALETPEEAVTFAAGAAFDFILEGTWDNGPVRDGDYPRGFYDHMNRVYDGVYAVAAVSRFDTIPHLEVEYK